MYTYTCIHVYTITYIRTYTYDKWYAVSLPQSVTRSYKNYQKLQTHTPIRFPMRVSNLVPLAPTSTEAASHAQKTPCVVAAASCIFFPCMERVMLEKRCYRRTLSQSFFPTLCGFLVFPPPPRSLSSPLGHTQLCDIEFGRHSVTLTLLLCGLWLGHLAMRV